MTDLLTPTERAELNAARTPDARCALLLEWVLTELRKTTVVCPTAPPVIDVERHEGQIGPGLPPMSTAGGAATPARKRGRR